MPNNQKTNLDDVLFKVEQRPLYVKHDKPPAPTLFDGQNKQLYFSEIDRFQAVVDVDRDYFPPVVYNYKLIIT